MTPPTIPPPRRYLRLPFGNDRLSQTATVVLVLLVLAGLLAPLLPIGDPEAIGAGPRLSPPGGGFPLGTDNLGRPMLARVFEGILLTFIVSTVAVLIASVVGALLGMIAAYTHRALDETVSRIADMLFSFPPVLLGLLVTAILSPGIHSAVAAIVLITLPAMVRVVRAATLDVARRDFVVVAEVAGASFGRRLFLHLLPNTAGRCRGPDGLFDLAWHADRERAELPRPRRPAAECVARFAAPRRGDLSRCGALARVRSRRLPRGGDPLRQPLRRRLARDGRSPRSAPLALAEAGIA